MCWAKSITLMAKSVRGAMADRDKSRIFAMQKSHKLNSCNHNKYKNPPIREDRRVFLCRQAMFPLAYQRSVFTQKEGHALAA